MQSSSSALYTKFLTTPEDVYVTNSTFRDNSGVACIEAKWRMLPNCCDNIATGNGGD